ncbi:MAG: DsbC family protein [Rhodanobacteraceae bacterium]
MRISRFIPGLVAGLLVVANVCAASPEDTVRQAMSALAPNVKIEAVQDSSIPGFYEAFVGGQFVYVSKDGRYVLDGSAYDVKNKQDLTEVARARVRKSALDKVGPDKRIIFAPADPKYTVTVFTDVDCPFCRRFHQQIAKYNADGIAVDYLFFPLKIHPGADKAAEAVWCSKDREDAFTAAMAGHDPGKGTCPTPVPELVQLGHSLGINGTPTVLAADGTQISPQIAMSPDQLAAELDRLAKADAARN